MPAAWSGVEVPSPPTYRVPRIAYEGPAGSIQVMDIDGTNDLALTSAIDFVPSFSPDGSKIAYAQFNTDDEIYVMNINGSNQTRLTSDPAQDQFPAFSPDGTKIVFGSNRMGGYEIWIMDVDGGHNRFLVKGSQGRWAPDSKRLAYAAQGQPSG